MDEEQVLMAFQLKDWVIAGDDRALDSGARLRAKTCDGGAWYGRMDPTSAFQAKSSELRLSPRVGPNDCLLQLLKLEGITDCLFPDLPNVSLHLIFHNLWIYTYV